MANRTSAQPERLAIPIAPLTADSRRQIATAELLLAIGAWLDATGGGRGRDEREAACLLRVVRNTLGRQNND